MTAEPEIRFCTSADGTKIGYAKLGQGPALVIVAPWSGDFEAAWDYPGGREFITAIAERCTCILLDRRGTGLSQHDAADLSSDAQAADLSALVEGEGLEWFDLFGGMASCEVVVKYAVANPDKVKHLITFGLYARGRDFRPQESVNSLAELATGSGWSIARRAYVDTNLPSGPPEAQAWLRRWLRSTADPQVFAEFVRSELELDISELLPKIAVPTLVLHRRQSQAIPISAVRSAAAQVNGARLIILDGDASFPWIDPQQLIKPIVDFIGGGPPSQPAKQEQVEPADSTFRAVLFTDLVGHMEMMSRLGDDKGREVLREHERIVREALAEHSGTEVKTMGDGFMASFGSVTKAVECAIALQRAFADSESDEPLSVRVGINAGEPIEEDGDLFGATVILASRIAAKAEGGEILVADTVRGLCSGKGFLFADRGEFVAKGFEDPVRLFDVRWSD